MNRTCPICKAVVEPNDDTCPNGHPMPESQGEAQNLSTAGFDFRPGASELRPLPMPDLGRLPEEPVIKPIAPGDLPTLAPPTASRPEIALPAVSGAPVSPFAYTILAEFRMPEESPPLAPLAVQIGLYDTVNVLDAGDPEAFRWVRFSPQGDVIDTVTVPRGSPNLQSPGGIALDAQDRLYVADAQGCLWRCEASGSFTTVAPNETFGSPLDVALDPSGHVIVAESRACRITKLDPAGRRTWSFGVPEPVCTVEADEEEEEEEEIEDQAPAGPPLPDQLANPSAVEVDTHGMIYVADTDHHRILKLDESGKFAGQVAQGAELLFPSGLKVSAAGDVYVADLDGSRVHKFDAAGQHVFSLTFENGSVGGEFDVDAKGDLYLPSKSRQAILKVRRIG